MPYCSNCGAEVAGNFCNSCGKPVGGASPAGPAQGQPAEAAPLTATGLTDNVAGGLCYLAGLITGILFLVLEPYSRKREIRFHAFQSIFFNLAVIAAYIAVGIVAGATGVIVPFMGLMISGLYMVIWLGTLILWIVLLVKTFQGSKIVLPVIGPLAQRQAG